MQFDPTQRRETWLFQETGGDPFNKHKPMYRCLRYVLVSYDGDPVRYLEPSPNEEFVNTTSTTGTNSHRPLAQQNIGTSDGQGNIAGFEFFTRRPFEVHAFDDVDAANNIGQLAPL